MTVIENGTTQDNRIALVGGTLIDGTGGDPLENAVVLVDGAVIGKAVRTGEIEIPSDCEIVDVAGKTVMPGMMDCHCHPSLTTLGIEKRLFTSPTVVVFQTAENLKRTLYAGFTTIRVPGGIDVGFRQAVEMGLVEGPRLVLASGFGQTGGHFDQYYPCGLSLSRRQMCDGVPEVQKAARKVLRKGYDFIKICTTGGVASPADDPEYTEWSLEELEAIVYEASARGKAVCAHAEGTQGVKNAIRSGVWSVEHGDILDDKAIQMFLDKGTYLVPTLSVTYEEIEIEHIDELGLTAVARAKAEKLAKSALESFEKAAAAGVKIAVGTDAYSTKMHGGNARELELMVRHGFTPMQAIVAATKTSAETCRVDHKVGTLEAGKLADLLVVDGNPLDNISILQDKSRLLLVMKEGTRYVNRLSE